MEGLRALILILLQAPRAVVRGRFDVDETYSVYGLPARLIGALLLLLVANAVAIIGLRPLVADVPLKQLLTLVGAGIFLGVIFVAAGLSVLFRKKRWAPIRYREFWDVPRIFLVLYQGDLLLFDCPSDEAAEDYPDWYHVYVLPALGEEELADSWAQLPRKAVRSLGKVPITHIQFDPTKRQSIDAALLNELTIRKSVAG